MSYNQLIIMSDEHTRHILGCYGNKIVKTPNLDRLAKRGTIFTNAYTNAPICVPARASFATGLYGHMTHHWDNATPYMGEPSSWGHELQKVGREVGSIGKLHYRNAEDDVGLDFQEIPMHVVNGVGDVLGCVREPLPKRWQSLRMAENIGPGETNYTNYDRNITQNAVDWIEGKKDQKEPWTVFVSLVAPHFPLIAPEAFYEQYADLDLVPSKTKQDDEHEWHQKMRECIMYDNFTPEKTQIALRSYYALVGFMDANVGRVLDALDASGLADNTQVIYTSDHGDNVGERGLWGKSNMFEESAGVPLIIAGPDIPKDHICETGVSLIDVYPTVLEAAKLKVSDLHPGKSLVKIANEANDANRVVFSEYHAMGSIAGAFMIRKGDWKLVHYVDMPPELYHLKDDPNEMNNLGSSEQYQHIIDELMAELNEICDPSEVNQNALADQKAIIDAHGGAKAVVEKGGFGATPAPGAKPNFG